ncbi:ABC transporter permease [Actinophytocola sp.]|uniref:ABC transporter permease n=1 Tax=Actinophytocola sp. TaxID=1872138 RepID=UPI002D7F75CA|nr:ABC transporter permease [Actinophytocola sp.]HET9142096.1 ABC transporter permease [Actinophytocola sp.]
MTAFVGTWSLVRLALRRDRILLPAWILVFVLFAASSAGASIGLYPTVESRVALGASANANPSLLALYGWVFDPTSLGAISLYKLVALGAAMVAVLTILVTVRHTRAEEESGRLELIGATVVGRYAALAAALIVATGASLVLGLLSAVGLMSPGLPAAGSFAFGLGWAATGIVFAAVAAVAAQLTAGARAATGIATAVLGAAYLIRAVGDSTGSGGPSWFSWLSPLSWSAQVRPFAGDRWWVLVLPLVFAAGLVVAAFALVARRDLGAGLLPDRRGPARAAAGLSSPLALAARLQRGALVGWATGFMVAGLVFGGIAANVGSLADSPQARDMITKLGGQQGLTDAFMATEMGFLAMIAAAYGIQAAMRLRSEETALRAEPVLATSVSRTRWALSHLVFALAGSAFLLIVAGLTAGLSYAAASDFGQFGRVFGAALAQLPAAMVLTGIAFAAFGLVPRYSVLGWAALAAFVAIGLVGPIIGVDQWVLDVSPFTHTPKLPGTAFTAVPLVWLAAVAAAAIAIGFAGFRRRDVT